MKSRLVLMVLALVLGCSALFAGMMPAAEELKALDMIVDKAMAAYNENDAKAFYADYATMMAAICTPEVFKTLIVDGYKAKFGNYVSRTIVEAETVIVPDVPNGLLVYSAKFEKDANAKLIINLIKENATWKLQQITIQPMP